MLVTRQPQAPDQLPASLLGLERLLCSFVGVVFGREKRGGGGGGGGREELMLNHFDRNNILLICSNQALFCGGKHLFFVRMAKWKTFFVIDGLHA